MKNTSYGTEWICFTCHRYLSRGHMPPRAVNNLMMLDEIPEELKKLNSLEKQLIALILPFSKIVFLIKQGQKGIHGPSVLVPTNVKKVQEMLPRSVCNADLIKVKLKRKLQYKGHYNYQQINPSNVKSAFMYLKEHNKYYKDINFDEDWLNLNTDDLIEGQCNSQSEENICEDSSIQLKTSVTTDNSGINETIQIENNGEQEADVNSQEDDLLDTVHQKENGVILDTCWQPTDLSAEPEAMQDSFEKIFCIAPCEDNKPVPFYKDMSSEVKAFPNLFPSGEYGFCCDRSTKVSLTKYFNARLMNADSRFASDTSYIFFSQYVSEHSQISSKMSVALRQGSPITKDGRQISKQLLASRTYVNELLKSDTVFRFMQPIRGTPSYWQRTLRDLFAAVRTLGPANWFGTFSAADMRWSDIITAIALQNGRVIDFSKLDWQEKCEILKSNPVTAARMFDHRVQNFIRDVLKSNEQPIGKITDFFYRVEFQARGSPHVHCLFYTDGPKFGKCTDSEFIQFIDKYNTCRLPDQETEPELYNIVTQVQVHSKSHSKSCKPVKNKPCRYSFPKQPADKTFIVNPNMVPMDEDFDLKKANAEKRLLLIWQTLQTTDESCSFADILRSVDVTNDEYEEAVNILSKNEKKNSKRNPNEVWINNYNSDLLLAWNGNMDWQPVLDVYSCIMYILSYISKAEHAMSQLLEVTLKEARNNNSDVKEQMKKLGSTYLTHRELSAQEAVYRALGLPLKHFTRDTVFVPAHRNCVRMSLPLASLQNSDDNDSDESPWMKNIVDRYLARPTHISFEKICLAKFASSFRVVKAKSDPNQAEKKNVSLESKTKFTLQNGLGEIAKRTRSKDAIIRFPKFSKTKQPEDYYFVLLKLYLPHRTDDQLKPISFETYEEFYTRGNVKYNKSEKLQKVSDIVDCNRILFEQNAEEIDKAEHAMLGDNNQFEDAWASIAPGVEQERNDDSLLMNSLIDNEDELVGSEEIDWPCERNDRMNSSSFGINVEIQPSVEKKNMTSQLEMLNEEQQGIFYFIRKWCIKKVHEKTIEPFFIFCNGSGGVGKSHLIHCIVYEASKILEVLKDNVEEIQIVTLAATGVASHNVNGNTIHSFFKLPTYLSLPYLPLGESVLNTLRCKLQKLEIIIIDEISMVSSVMLHYIHCRLSQIRQDSRPFGNVPILAVGDFFQLAPVKGTALYKTPPCDLWQENFKIVSLTKIMRQNNIEFAEMLNRLRVHVKGNELDARDSEILHKRSQLTIPLDILHVFSKNKDVDTFNNMMLEKTGNEVYSLNAIDFVKQGSKTYKKKKNIVNDGLPLVIKISIGCKIMITRNISVTDGICNGSFGIVTAILMKDNDPNVPRCVCVEFEDKNVGRNLKTMSSGSGIPEGSVCIFPFEEQYQDGKIKRLQFPLKLAFAATIHKVQGLTVDSICVSLKSIFAPGMGYVAVSRCRDLCSLYITDFDRNNPGIYCNEEVAVFLENMTPLDLSSVIPLSHCTSKVTIVYHNVEGLACHMKGILSNSQICKASIFFASETWIQSRDDTSGLEIPGFFASHKFRDQCLYYLNKPSSKGGISIYVREAIVHELIEIDNNVENIALFLPEYDCMIVGFYRSPSYPIELFLEHLCSIVNSSNLCKAKNVIITGDFNEDLLSKNKKNFNILMQFGFKQLIKEPTTDKGTLLDVFYYRGDLSVMGGVMQSYFSYHNPIFLTIE